jgi:hypothetical protein
MDILKRRYTNGSISTVIKEIQIKTTIRDQLTPVRKKKVIKKVKRKAGCQWLTATTQVTQEVKIRRITV